jgi:uncharacterized protein YbjT (DUF2867 family)
MKVIVVGASGMVGQGVLRECLLDREVERVLVVGRRALDRAEQKTEPKLVERVVTDLTDLSAIAADLQGYDACFFCLGITSVGMTEAEYRKVTYDITAAFVKALAPSAAGMTFVFVSGRGTDGTEKGKVMWARVKGAAENLVLGAGFKAAYAFRPGVIQPLHGIRSRTAAYRILYTAFSPVFGAMKLFAPQSIATTESVGRAMLEAARRGAPQKILENRDINALASRAGASVKP